MKNNENKKAVPAVLEDDLLKNVSGGAETGTKCIVCGTVLTKENELSLCERCAVDPLIRSFVVDHVNGSSMKTITELTSMLEFYIGIQDDARRKMFEDAMK